VKRTGLIVAGAVAAWLGITVLICSRTVLNDGATAVIALFTGVPVAYAAGFLLLAPRRKTHAGRVVFQVSLSLLGLFFYGVAIQFGCASGVPIVAVLVGPVVLLGNLMRLAPEASALFRQRSQRQG